jgi:hypothetical protein
MKLRGLGPFYVACGILGLVMVVVYELLRASGLGIPMFDMMAFWLLTFMVALFLRVRVYRRNRFGEVLLAVILGATFAYAIAFGVWMGAVWLVKG